MRSTATKPLLTILIVLASDPLAFGQAGSIGGVIGKTDKSISGGGAASEPPAQPTSRSRARPPVDKGASGRSSVVSVAGSWHWIADCNSGHWQGGFDLVETSRGQFNGSFSGSWGSIANGYVNGSSISFTRTVAVVTQYWRGQLAGGRIKGTLSGNENCSWEATKK
jgi:hypothetical protein